MGTYCSKSDVEAKFGVDNVAEWANLDNADPPVDADDRIDAAIAYAEAHFHLLMRRGPYTIPLSTTDTDDLEYIKDICVTFAGKWLYNVKGITTQDQDDRFARLMSESMTCVEYILSGVVELDAEKTRTSNAPTGPVVATEDDE